MNILCPVCKKILHKSDKVYSCENRHSFDIAKEGYLNLNLKNSQNTGDNTEMIRARKAFLEKDYYDFPYAGPGIFCKRPDTYFC